LIFPEELKLRVQAFPFYVGEMSQLVRALINFFLEEAGTNGYEEVHSPIVVNAESATATGQLPDKEGQMYLDQNEEVYLIPTAEVPVTNFLRDEILSAEQLPVKEMCLHPLLPKGSG
jgi:seryl-tRNA synthetase